jgi:hypothetical protein
MYRFLNIVTEIVRFMTQKCQMTRLSKRILAFVLQYTLFTRQLF